MTTPFVPKVWADLQAGGTAITAAELNRMERGIDLGQMRRPGGYQPDGSRRAAFSFGCGGEGTFTDKNVAWQRLPIQIPVASSRWRLRISNKTPTGTSTGAGATTFGPFYIADGFRNLTTGDPIPWVGNQVQVLPTQSQVGAGVDFVSGWITDPAHQLKARTTQYISFGWSKTAGSTVYTSSGGGWYSTVIADMTKATNDPAMTYTAQTAYAVTVEYEFFGDNKIGVAVGDSITEGAKHVFSIWSWHQRLSMRLNMPMCLSAQFGSFAGAGFTNNWGSEPLTAPRWQRLRDADCNIDFGLMYLGTNETAWGGNLTGVQDGLISTKNRMISEWGVFGEIAALTLHPRNMLATDGGEILRKNINAWLTSGAPNFEVFDLQRNLEAGVDSVNLRATYEGGGADRTHPGPRGQMAIADAIQISAE